jgi:hypothetical protein
MIEGKEKIISLNKNKSRTLAMYENDFNQGIYYWQRPL